MASNRLKPIKVHSKKFGGSGSRLIFNFLDQTSERLIKNILRFSEQSMSDGIEDHAFWYSERQVKGQLAAALDNVCDGYFLQEPPVARSLEREDAPSDENNHGWCDFWCRYGETKKINVLLEVKHSWARYWVDKPIAPYAHSVKRHEDAVSQIKSIKKIEYINDHLFAAALTILPIFTRHKTIDRPKEMSSDSLKGNLTAVLNNFGAHSGYAVSLPSELNFVATLDHPKLYESYPAVMLIWSLDKVHRDRR